MSDKRLRRRVKTFLLSAKYWWVLIGVALLSRISTLLFPFDSDHWIFYYVGNHWFAGGTLYLTAWDHKTPVIFAINGFMSFVFGNNLLLHRLFFTFIAGLSLWVFYTTAKRLMRYIGLRNIEGSARISTLVFGFWSNLSQFTNSGNTTENFGVLVILLALYCYLRFVEERHWKWLLYSGASISILVFLKINFSILLIPLVIDFVRRELPTIKSFVAYGMVWVFPTLFQAYYWAAYFNARKMLPDAIIAGISFNGKYLRAGWAGNLSGQLLFIAILGIALLFFAGFIFFAIKQKPVRNKKIFIFSIAATTIIFGGILGTFYTHYYLITVPYLSLLVAVYWREVMSSKILVIASIIGIFGSFGVSSKQLYNRFYGSAHSEAVQMKNAANYINIHTTNNDKIIYDGYGATFYQLANRDSGSRFISASHPLIDEREGFGYNFTGKHIGDMAMNEPKYIIINKATKDLYDQNMRAAQYFNNHYTLEIELPGYEILRRSN